MTSLITIHTREREPHKQHTHTACMSLLLLRRTHNNGNSTTHSRLQQQRERERLSTWELCAHTRALSPSPSLLPSFLPPLMAFVQVIPHTIIGNCGGGGGSRRNGDLRTATPNEPEGLLKARSNIKHICSPLSLFRRSHVKYDDCP